MIANQPVLVSIKSNWESISERPTVGKDVLELLSSSMYVNPLSIYREYVQNAADSIEEATALGLLNRHQPGRVEITVDIENRVVQIRDNGTGISKMAFARTLVALGASRKRGTKARGFRGVGRLAGLGYCRELIFRAQADGEREISEMRWDCQRLRSILRDVSFKGDVEELIKEVVRVQRLAGEQTSAHYFEVELRGIVRHGDDRLMNSEAIGGYLSQVAPVPFSPAFRFAGEIENKVREDVGLGTVRIYLNGTSEPLYRPHCDTFDARKGIIDKFVGVRLLEIKGDSGELAAIGWVLDHSYLGAIDTAASIKGLRLRSGNMQVGDSDVLEDLFTEPRFNAWVVGEFHVLDERILPNGRRDHFEQNVHFANLLNQLRPIAVELSRKCRQSSVRRNIIREFDAASERVLENSKVVRQGVLASKELARLESETTLQLERMEKSCSNTLLSDMERTQLETRFRNAKRQWQKAPVLRRSHRALKRLGQKERMVLERVFTLIYECSANEQSARKMIDRILVRL